jgi:predicted transcriptional regulator
MRVNTKEDIEKEFGLNAQQAEYHLAMLEKGLVIERAEGGYRSTLTGRLYLEKVENRR